MRLRAGVLVAVLAFGVVTVVSPVAVAQQPTWTTSVVPWPPDHGAPLQYSSAIACPAPGDCILVGTYNGIPDGGQSYIDTISSGTVVSSIPAPLPGDAQGPPYEQTQTLDSLSCWAVGACVAVGSYTTSTGQTGLIETLHAGRWTPRRSPAHSGAQYSGLDEVACNSQRCVATGARIAPDLVTRVAGGRWVTQVVTSSIGGRLLPEHPACPATGPCYLNVRAHPNTLDERVLFGYQVGTAWHAVYYPIPPGGNAKSLTLGRMSCSADGDCVAFGGYQEHGVFHFHPVVERFAAGQLHVHALSTPDGYRDSYDIWSTGVSCASPRRCAGFASGAGGTVLYAMVHGRWQSQLASADLFPTDASCSAEGACAVVGGTGANLAVATVSNGSWTQTDLGLPEMQPRAHSGLLAVVDCAERTCVTAGSVNLRRRRPFARAVLVTGRQLPTA